MRERLIGYLLLLVGILLMGYALMQVYSVFTGQTKPFQVTRLVAKNTETPQAHQAANNLSTENSMTALQSQMIKDIMNTQMEGTMDIGATVFFFYFVMTLGFKLASLGVDLMRPITVKLRSKTLEEDIAKVKGDMPL